MSHVTYMNESCHIYEWVMSHIWMSHVTYMNESCHIYEWVMSYIYILKCHVSHVSHVSHVWHVPPLIAHVSCVRRICTFVVAHMVDWCRIFQRSLQTSHTHTHTHTCTCKDAASVSMCKDPAFGYGTVRYECAKILHFMFSVYFCFSMNVQRSCICVGSFQRLGIK